jgi:putative sigma-54 modulation protein
MQITMTGRGVELTEALKDYVEKKLGLLEKFYEHIERIEVAVGRETHHHQKGDVFFAEAKAIVPGTDLFIKEEAGEAYAAVDALRDRLEYDLKKHKEKMGGRKHSEEVRGTKEYIPEE